MNKEILKSPGLNKEVARVEKGACPICAKPIVDTDFKDELSRKEFRISGMCQKCQDQVFG